MQIQVKRITRNNFHTLRIVLLVSLFWILIYTFLIFYLTERFGYDSNTELKPKTNKIQKIITNLINNPNKKSILGKRDDDKLKHDFALMPNLNVALNKYFNDSTKSIVEVFQDQWLEEDYSSRSTNPSEWPGENGRPVFIESDDQRKMVSKRFAENEFNIVVSEMIALNRSLPDQRNAECKKKRYSANLPTTSIIIVYHNEGYTTLLRGIISIVNRSPKEFLKEIILVDDASEGRDYLHGPLDEFVKKLPVPVKIFRNKKRIGLIRSRLRGADAATGDTMTFLDAHIEVTNGWLPPLLSEIKNNK